MDYKVVQVKRSFRQHQGKIIIGSFLLIACIAACVLIPAQQNDNSFLESGPERTLASTRTISDFTIVNTYIRRGAQYYTEGLIWKDSNTLVESAGQYGESELHLVSFPGMVVTKKTPLANKYFAEGIVMYTQNGVSRIYQLTWKERAFLVYNADTLKLVQTKTMPSSIKEGWGLTKSTVNGKLVFWASDGTGNIHQIDPVTLRTIKSISCKKRDGTRLNRLNELEYVNGKIWANIFPTTNVAVIDPSTGYADYIIDFSRLATLAKNQARAQGLKIVSGDVLNGMAYDSTNDRLIVTGKMWPVMWEIKVDF